MLTQHGRVNTAGGLVALTRGLWREGRWDPETTQRRAADWGLRQQKFSLTMLEPEVGDLGARGLLQPWCSLAQESITWPLSSSFPHLHMPLPCVSVSTFPLRAPSH